MSNPNLSYSALDSRYELLGGFTLNAKKYGATGDGITDDTVSLQAALNDAAAKKLPLFIPAGTYKTTAELTITGGAIQIFGAGAYLTLIRPVAATYNGLHIIGTGGRGPSGYLRDLQILGQNDRATTGKALLVLDNIRMFEVERVRCQSGDIGIDMINGCQGTILRTVEADFASCNVGLNLRNGTASGSDMAFINCWLGGQRAAVHMSPNSGGWRFFECQFTSGNSLSSADDLAGGIILGKDYLDNTTGGVHGVSIVASSFEGSDYSWQVRTFDEVDIHFDGVAFQANNSSRPAIGVFKMESSKNSSINLRNCRVKGYYTPGDGKLVKIAGNNSLFLFKEEGTTSSTTYVDGTNLGFGNPKSLTEQSLLGSVAVLRRQGLRTEGGLGFGVSNGRFAQTTDWGTTWSGYALSSELTAAASPPAIPLPSLNKAKGWVYDPIDSSGTAQPTTGQLALMKCPIAPGSTVVQIAIDVSTTGATAAGVLGLYDKSGTLLVTSADVGSSSNTVDSVTLNSAGGGIVRGIIASTILPSDAYVFVAVLITAAGTIPTLRQRAGGQSSASINWNLVPADGLRAGTFGTGLTSLPSTVTLSSVSVGNRLYWGGVA